MIELWVIRHGKTVWNEERRAQGLLNSPLSEKGIRAIERKKKQFQSTFFIAGYSSPLGRAKETFERLFEGTLQPILDDRLTEATLGVLDGYTMEEMMKQYPSLKPYRHCMREAPMEGIESYEKIWQRVYHFIEHEIKEKYAEQMASDNVYKIAVLSHGATIIAFDTIMNKQPMSAMKEKLPIGNLEVLCYSMSREEK